MTSPFDRPSAQAKAEAYKLLDQLGASTLRDRAAFAFGYVLAFNAMAHHLPPAEFGQQYARAQALHALCTKDFQ